MISMSRPGRRALALMASLSLSRPYVGSVIGTSVSMLAILCRGPTIPKKRAAWAARWTDAVSLNSLLVRHPCRAGLVVFEAGSALQIILGLIEREPPFVVLLGVLHSIERYDHIFLAGTEKAANPDDQPGDLAGLVDQNVIDVADLAFFGVIDALFVVIGNGPAVGRSCRHRRSAVCAADKGDGQRTSSSKLLHLLISPERIVIEKREESTRVPVRGPQPIVLSSKYRQRRCRRGAGGRATAEVPISQPFTSPRPEPRLRRKQEL